MPTIGAQPATNRFTPSNRRYDRVFFSGMVLLILATVLAGFGPTYFFRGGPAAALPSPIIHIHAIVFTAWILLLLIQTGLISARQVALHRTLGLAGFGLAILVTLAGFLAMASQLHFRASRGDRELTFSAVSLEGVVLFTVFASLAYITRRRDLAAHKRYILLASLGLLDAAIFRLRLPWVGHNLFHTDLVVLALVLILVAYDLFALRKILPSTLYGGLFLIVIQQLTIPFGNSSFWHTCARTIQSWRI